MNVNTVNSEVIQGCFLMDLMILKSPLLKVVLDEYERYSY